MRYIIAGGRDFNHYPALLKAMAFFADDITEVVSGGAQGADALGQYWAQTRQIPVKVFLPDWHNHGPKAGPMRNREMAEYADALLVFWDGKSRGTKNMIDEMFKRGKSIFVQGYCYQSAAAATGHPPKG